MSSSDFGSDPIVIDLIRVAKENTTFRTSIWTGTHLQITVMSLLPVEDIGLEMHENLDQLVVIIEGEGLLTMGKEKDNLDLSSVIEEGEGFIVPATYWHNFTNISETPLKLVSVYGPPSHPYETVQPEKADALEDEMTMPAPETDTQVADEEA